MLRDKLVFEVHCQWFVFDMPLLHRCSYPRYIKLEMFGAISLEFIYMRRPVFFLVDAT